MKTLASALFLTLTLLLAGCANFKSFTYSSPEGKTCLNKCEKARWACRDKCGENAICANDCEEAAKTCRKNCPAASAVEPESVY